MGQPDADGCETAGLEEHAASWEALGTADPLWGVCSIPGGRDGGWDLDTFFAAGRSDAAALHDKVERAGATFRGEALDFGCGVGRLSQALAAYVDRVVGVDIAQPMVDLANAMNTQPDTVDFIVSKSYELPFHDASFDVAVSLYVFQHMEPGMSLRFLRELVRVLRRGGTLVVQITSEPRPITPVPVEARRATLEIVAAPTSLRAGEVGSVRVRLRNGGTEAWPSGQLIKLGNHWRRDGEIVVADDGRLDLPAALAAGDSIDLDLRICAPEQAGSYDVEIDVVQEFVAWWAETGNPTARRSIDVVADSADGDERAKTAKRVGDSIIKMYGLPKADVLVALEDAGCVVLAAESDEFEPAGWLSYTYVATRVGAHVPPPARERAVRA